MQVDDKFKEMEAAAARQIEIKKMRFKQRWGIHANIIEVTQGERALRLHRRFKKWCVKHGSETPLRKVWTVVDINSEMQEFKMLEMVEIEQKATEAAVEG